MRKQLLMALESEANWACALCNGALCCIPIKRWLNCHNRVLTRFIAWITALGGKRWLLSCKATFHLHTSELVNVYGAQESIPPAYVAWRAGTPKRVVGPAARQAGNRFLVALKGLQIRALVNRRLYVNYIKDEEPSSFIFKSSCPPFFHHQKDKMMGEKSFVHTLKRRGNGGGPLCVHCTLYYTANEILGVPRGA